MRVSMNVVIDASSVPMVVMSEPTIGPNASPAAI